MSFPSLSGLPLSQLMDNPQLKSTSAPSEPPPVTQITNSEHSMPHFPQEIINLILRKVDDLPFLWIVCRTVSRAVRQEVEFIFEHIWLKETELLYFSWVPLTGHYNSFHYSCRFSRRSPDNRTAYFHVQAVETRAYRHTPGLLQSASFADLAARVRCHQKFQTKQWYNHNVRAMVRIGSGVTNTYMLDALLPPITSHSTTQEISLEWPHLFTNFFREEQLFSSLKAAEGIHTPSIRPVRLRYPMIIGSGIPASRTSSTTNNGSSAWPMLLAVRQHRAKVLSWPQHENENDPHERTNAQQESDFKDATEGALARLLDLRGILLTSQIMMERNLQPAMCRGSVFFVEDPGLNGWKKYSVRQRRLFRNGVVWYNHAKTVGGWMASKDLVVMEVQRMARAWERGWD